MSRVTIKFTASQAMDAVTFVLHPHFRALVERSSRYELSVWFVEALLSRTQSETTAIQACDGSHRFPLKQLIGNCRIYPLWCM